MTATLDIMNWELIDIATNKRGFKSVAITDKKGAIVVQRAASYDEPLSAQFNAYALNDTNATRTNLCI